MKLNKTEIREIAKELAEQAEDRMDDIFTEVVMDMVHYGDHEDDDLHEDDNEMGLSDKDYNAIFKAAFTILGDKANKYARGGETSGDINIGMF